MSIHTPKICLLGRLPGFLGIFVMFRGFSICIAWVHFLNNPDICLSRWVGYPTLHYKVLSTAVMFKIGLEEKELTNNTSNMSAKLFLASTAST